MKVTCAYIWMGIALGGVFKAVTELQRLTRLHLLQLLDYGADVNATSAKGRTALQRCVKGNGVMFPMDLQMVTLLLQHGANPFCADHKGDFTSLHNKHKLFNSCTNSKSNNDHDNCRSALISSNNFLRSR